MPELRMLLHRPDGHLRRRVRTARGTEQARPRVQDRGLLPGQRGPRRGGGGRVVTVRMFVLCAYCSVPFDRKRSVQRCCSRECGSANRMVERTPAQRYWARVTRTEDVDDCWGWTGGTNSDGYGVLWVDGRNVGTHVFSYELHIGPVPGGQWVLHTCDATSCSNPRHLYTGTPKQNSRDRDARGRANTPTGDRNWTRLYPDKVRRGEDKSQAKMTWPKVREIRRRVAMGETRIALAREFGVDRSVVSRIASGKSWPLRGEERPW